MKQVLGNCRLFDGERVHDGVAVVIGEGRVLELLADSQGVADAAVVDLDGHLLAPGLVDLQVNGGGGVLFNVAPTVETLQQIAAAHRQFGTTTFLPTLISDDADVITRGIEAVAAAMRGQVPGIAGIHIEGPHLNPDFRGAHDAAKFRPLDDEALTLLTSLSEGRTLVTIAPETVPEEMIRRLRASGVIVFGGHSGASYEEARAALAAGLGGFTHLFNAMTPLTSRAPGMVGAALEDNDSYVGIIADGHHLHPSTLRLAIKAKAVGKVVLVTDAMPTVGSSDKTFALKGETIHAEGGRCLTTDGKLVGTDIGLIEAVRNTCRFGGVDKFEALRMASRYPAEAIGMADQLGSIRPGYPANLIELDSDLKVVRSWIAGDMADH